MSKPKGDAALEDVSDAAEEETVGSGELTQRQERALHAVIAHLTRREAAQAAGVSDATLWRYMQDKGFKQRLSEAREASTLTRASNCKGLRPTRLRFCAS